MERWADVDSKQREQLVEDEAKLFSKKSILMQKVGKIIFMSKYDRPLYEMDGTIHFVLPPTFVRVQNDSPNFGKETVQNVASNTESLKYTYLGDHGYIPASARTGFKWFGRIGGQFGTIFLGTDLYQDYHKYSGIDLAYAWGSDLIPIVAGVAGAAGGTVVGGAVGGYIGGVAGGTVGAYAKDYVRKDVLHIKTDKEKERANKKDEKE